MQSTIKSKSCVGKDSAHKIIIIIILKCGAEDFSQSACVSSQRFQASHAGDADDDDGDGGGGSGTTFLCFPAFGI